MLLRVLLFVLFLTSLTPACLLAKEAGPISAKVSSFKKTAEGKEIISQEDDLGTLKGRTVGLDTDMGPDTPWGADLAQRTTEWARVFTIKFDAVFLCHANERSKNVKVLELSIVLPEKKEEMFGKTKIWSRILKEETMVFHIDHDELLDSAGKINRLVSMATKWKENKSNAQATYRSKDGFTLQVSWKEKTLATFFSGINGMLLYLGGNDLEFLSAFSQLVEDAAATLKTKPCP